MLKKVEKVIEEMKQKCDQSPSIVEQEITRKAIGILQSIQTTYGFADARWKEFGACAKELASRCEDAGVQEQWKRWCHETWCELFGVSGRETKESEWRFFLTLPAPREWVEEHLKQRWESRSPRHRLMGIIGLKEESLQEAFEDWKENHGLRDLSWRQWCVGQVEQLWHPTEWIPETEVEGFSGRSLVDDIPGYKILDLPLELLSEQQKIEWWEGVRQWCELPKKMGVRLRFVEEGTTEHSWEKEGTTYRFRQGQLGHPKINWQMSWVVFDLQDGQYHWLSERLSLELTKVSREEIEQSIHHMPEVWRRSIEGGNMMGVGNAKGYRCNTAQFLVAYWGQMKNPGPDWAIENQFAILERLEAMGISVLEPDSTGVIPFAEHPWVKEQWLKKMCESSIGSEQSNPPSHRPRL